MEKNTKKPAVAGDTQIKSLYADENERQRFRDDLTAAVKMAFAKQEQEPDPRTRFHEQFQKEADEYDRDIRKKYHDDFTSTLIFAGLFSAVASAFIIDVQSQMRPDYNQMSFTALTMLLNTTSGMPNHLPLPTFPGPSPSIVQVQSILFASLLSALLAAFLAMLGKQWMNLHVEGSFVDRNRHREQKMRGMITWRFKFVVELLPLTLQASLLLLGYALARYLWDVSHTVSLVISGFTAVGVVMYLLIVVAGTVSRTCPFQTPLSITIRAILEFYRKDISRAFEAVRNIFRFARSQRELILHRQQLSTPPIASDIDDQDSEVRAELRCILTMFKMTKAPDSVQAIMVYITEIIWDDRLKSVPLLQVYRALCESLLRSSNGEVYPRPGARDRALWCAKALLHLYNQRRYIRPHDTTLTNQTKFIDHQSQPLGHHGFEKDFDLQSTFYIVDWTFGVQPKIHWPDLELSESHHCWLAHILQYRAWESLYARKGLPEDVGGFVSASLSSRSSPARVVADCLSIIRMIVGHRPQPQDLLIKDQSNKITEFITKIFDRLDDIFVRNIPGDTSSAIEALELVVNLRDSRICARSYSLFRTIVDKAKGEDVLWSPARLCLRGAYSGRTVDVPKVGNPEQLLKFLRHHMQQPSSVRRDHIGQVFKALVVASNEETDRALAAHNFTDTPLIDTVIEVLENKDSVPDRKSAVFVLAKLDNHLFTTDEAFKDQERASRFVAAWSSAISEFLGDPAHPYHIEKTAVKVLLAIANLPCLRVHLPKDRWTLVAHFPYIMLAKPPPLQRCLENPTIFPFLKKAMDARAQNHWLGMLWVMYHDLSPNVLEQLKKETQQIAAGDYSHHLDTFVYLIDSYLSNLRTQIDGLDPMSQDASDRQGKSQRMMEARKVLLGYKKHPTSSDKKMGKP